MSKPESRGSLIGLRSTFPTVPTVGPVILTAEMEERVLGSEATTQRLTSLQTYSGSTAPAATAPLEATQETVTPGRTGTSRKGEPTVLMNAKLPLSLHSRLKRTAQFNDISMTDILIRAIEIELATGKYSTPPGIWGSDFS